MQPLRQRSWAPRGHRPVLDVWHRHDRLSVVGALALSPTRRRVGCYFQVQSTNIVTPDVVGFVKQLHRQLRRPLTLIWDRWPVHRSANRLLSAKFDDWLRIEYLPGYAPDLNPVEGMWGHTKRVPLGNFQAYDIHHLDDAVNEALCDLHDTPRLLWSCFALAQLDTS